MWKFERSDCLEPGLFALAISYHVEEPPTQTWNLEVGKMTGEGCANGSPACCEQEQTELFQLHRDKLCCRSLEDADRDV